MMKEVRWLILGGLILSGIFAFALSGCGSRHHRTMAALDSTPPPEGMVLIPAGQFQMGSNDYGAADDEQPVHTVIVHLDAFFMDKYEVTNAQYKAFVDANPQRQKDNVVDKFSDHGYLWFWTGTNYPAGKANHPVRHVSWYAAMAYAEYVGKRLPTEAEWEYAARGGLAGQTYPSGNTISTRQANYNRHVGDTTAVGRYAANGYGLYDMAGNVWEWCLGKYDNPWGPWGARVLRGGSWDSPEEDLHVADRLIDDPISTGWYGFRCVRAVTPGLHTNAVKK